MTGTHSQLTLSDAAGTPVLALEAPDLTAVQAKSLLAVWRLTVLAGQPATTQRAIAGVLRVQQNAAVMTIHRLERKGYLAMERLHGRTIRLAKPLVWRPCEGSS